MTDDDKRIAEIEAREKATTRGRWYVDRNFPEVKAGNDRVLYYVPSAGNYADNYPNLHFSAEAHQDIPWLISKLRERDTQIERLKAILENCGEALHHGIALDYFAEGGSTEGWVLDCIKSIRDLGLMKHVPLEGESGEGEKGLKRMGHRNEPEGWDNPDKIYGYLQACEDVIADARAALEKIGGNNECREDNDWNREA